MNPETAKANRAEWMRRGKWGVFMHFLSREKNGIPMTPECWNAQVDAFDVDILAEQLAELEAGWFFLTLGQNSGWFCSPNATLDTLTGRPKELSHCSRRDLVADLQQALARFQIPLLVYLPCHAPMGDEEASIALHGIPPWDFHKWSPMPGSRLKEHADSDPRLRTFLRNWEKIIREWSLRWGRRVKGWWFDGCYNQDLLYDFPDEPNFNSLASAVRCGNPDAIFCANPGVFRDPVSISSEEDYTSGENTRPDRSSCFSPRVGNALYHILTYAGTIWCSLPLRYNGAELSGISSNIIDGGGVITWEVPYLHPTGTLGEETMRVFREWRDFLKRPRRGWCSRITVLEPPVHGCRTTSRPGRARVEIMNPESEPLRGELTISGNAPFTLDLPGGAVATGEVALLAERNRITLQFSGETRFLEYAPRFRTKVECRRSGEAPCFTPPIPFRSDGCETGNIRLAFFNDHLLARATVYEKQRDIIIHRDLWRNSCLELFLDFGEGIRQYFFPPVEGAEHGFFLDAERRYQEAPESRCRLALQDEKHEIELELPFTGNPEEVRLECKLSVCHNGHVQRATLFGSEEFFAHSDEFGRFFWK